MGVRLVFSRFMASFKTTTVGLRHPLLMFGAQPIHRFKTTTVGLRHEQRKQNMQLAAVSKPLRLD